MTQPLIRQGEGHHAYHRIQQMLLEEEHKLRRLIDTTPDPPSSNTITRATAGGDERKLRGIPAIARGVPGHIPHTRPDRIQ